MKITRNVPGGVGRLCWAAIVDDPRARRPCTVHVDVAAGGANDRKEHAFVTAGARTKADMKIIAKTIEPVRSGRPSLITSSVSSSAAETTGTHRSSGKSPAFNHCGRQRRLTQRLVSSTSAKLHSPKNQSFDAQALDCINTRTRRTATQDGIFVLTWAETLR